MRGTKRIARKTTTVMKSIQNKEPAIHNDDDKEPAATTEIQVEPAAANTCTSTVAATDNDTVNTNTDNTNHPNNNDNTNHKTNDNTTITNNTESSSEYPTAWPPSARRRGSELEEQLRNAPALDMIRVAMVVGFGVLHSNGLDLYRRNQFLLSLVHYLNHKGYLRASACYTNVTASIATEILRTFSHQNHALLVMQQQQQAMIVMLQQQAQQLRQRQLQAQQQRQAQQATQQRERQMEQQGSGEIYNGPSEPIADCPDLTGWIKKSYKRYKSGPVDHFWFTPKLGCRLRSKTEVQRYFQFFQGDNEKEAALQAKRKRRRVSEEAERVDASAAENSSIPTEPSASPKQPQPTTPPGTVAAIEELIGTQEEPVVVVDAHAVAAENENDETGGCTSSMDAVHPP